MLLTNRDLEHLHYFLHKCQLSLWFQLHLLFCFQIYQIPSHPTPIQGAMQDLYVQHRHYIFKVYFYFLKGIIIEIKKQRGTSSNHWFTHQTTARTRTWADCSQEPGIPSRFIFGHPPLLSQVLQQGARSEVEQPRFELAVDLLKLQSPSLFS